jgi:hypothetical protein
LSGKHLIWCPNSQKNKSAKVKQEVARIQAQAAVTGKSRATVEKEKEQQMRAKEKLEEEKRKKEEALLLKPVQTQKVPFGVDPKTVLCAFYKAGHCEKGNKCKFSHDLNVERRVEKKNLYEDSREEKLNGMSYFWHVMGASPTVLQILWTNGTKRNWPRSSSPRPETLGQRRMYVLHRLYAPSSDQLSYRSCASISFRPSNLRSESLVPSAPRPFLTCSSRFGWFWECPNGEQCQYRHALPPGFVLKSQRKAAEEAAKAKVISLEEFLEVEV